MKNDKYMITDVDDPIWDNSDLWDQKVLGAYKEGKITQEELTELQKDDDRYINEISEEEIGRIFDLFVKVGIFIKIVN
jgi:hypothetical protein